MQSEICAPPRAVRRVIHSATKSPPAIELYEVTPEAHHKLRVVSHELYSVWVHQSARRPVPCYGEGEHECEFHRLPLKQQHYLYVELPDNPKLRLVRLTSGLVYRVLPQLSEVGRDLNGMMLELWREHSGKHDSGMLGAILPDECVDALVRETPDIEWAVQRMLTAPDRLAPWTRRRPTPPPRRTMSASAEQRPLTAEQKDLISQALQRAKAGDTQGATALLELSKSLPTGGTTS